MTPFWPAAATAGATSLYGTNPSGNLSVVPPKELHSDNVSGRATNSSQDKGHGFAMFPGHVGKDKGSSQPSNVDNSSRKKILLQQTLPPHGPTFIFPLNQQQAVAAAVAASVRPGSVKSLPITSNGPPSSAPNSTPPNPVSFIHPQFHETLCTFEGESLRVFALTVVETLRNPKLVV